MTLLASVILTGQFGIDFERRINEISVFLGGIYMGFSCFDCCGRWSSRRYSFSSEVFWNSIEKKI